MYHNLDYVSELSKEFNNNIDLEHLFNVSYDINTSEVKFYSFSEDMKYLKKYSKDNIVNQCIPKFHKNMNIDYEKKVIEFLGYKPDFNKIVIDIVDVVMDVVIYFHTGFASSIEFEKFYRVVLEKFKIEEKLFFKALSIINNIDVVNFESAFKYKAVSLCKVPLNKGAFKVYAKPFRNGHDFNIDEGTSAFLKKLFSCTTLKKEYLKDCWTIYEISTGRQQFCTHDRKLKARLYRLNKT